MTIHTGWWIYLCTGDVFIQGRRRNCLILALWSEVLQTPTLHTKAFRIQFARMTAVERTLLLGLDASITSDYILAMSFSGVPSIEVFEIFSEVMLRCRSIT